MKLATTVVLVLGFQLAGCEGPAEPPTPKTEDAAQTGGQSSTPFDSQIKTLKNAQETGAELEKAEAARQQQLEQARQ